MDRARKVRHNVEYECPCRQESMCTIDVDMEWARFSLLMRKGRDIDYRC